MFQIIIKYLLFILMLIAAIVIRFNIDAKAEMINELKFYLNNHTSQFSVSKDLREEVDTDLLFHFIQVIEPDYKISRNGNDFLMIFYIDNSKSDSIRLHVKKVDEYFRLTEVQGYALMLQKLECFLSAGN